MCYCQPVPASAAAGRSYNRHPHTLCIWTTGEASAHLLAPVCHAGDLAWAQAGSLPFSAHTQSAVAHACASMWASCTARIAAYVCISRHTAFHLVTNINCLFLLLNLLLPARSYKPWWSRSKKQAVQQPNNRVWPASPSLWLVNSINGSYRRAA